VAYDPEPWHDFATSFAGAAGALLGLAFVAISFNLEAILRDKTLPGRPSRLWRSSRTRWQGACLSSSQACPIPPSAWARQS